MKHFLVVLAITVTGLITPDLQALLEQRVYGLVCGYEDLNDHDSLRVDPVFQLLIGKVPQLEPVLAGRNTLNRKEQFQLFSYRLSAGV